MGGEVHDNDPDHQKHDCVLGKGSCLIICLTKRFQKGPNVASDEDLSGTLARKCSLELSRSGFGALVLNMVRLASRPENGPVGRPNAPRILLFLCNCVGQLVSTIGPLNSNGLGSKGHSKQAPSWQDYSCVWRSGRTSIFMRLLLS